MAWDLLGRWRRWGLTQSLAQVEISQRSMVRVTEGGLLADSAGEKHMNATWPRRLLRRPEIMHDSWAGAVCTVCNTPCWHSGWYLELSGLIDDLTC